MPGKAKSIAVGPKGTAYVIGADDVIYQWTGNQWERIGDGAVAIAAGAGREPSAPETLFMVAADGGIRRYRAGSWETLPGNASASMVSVGTDGKTWILGAETNPAGNRTLSEWNPATSQWDSANGGTGTRMAVGARGSLWTVNAQNEIYQFLAGAWTKKPGNARDITVGPAGELWVIGTNNLENGDSTIYRGAADGTVWEGVEGEGIRIAAGPDYLWVVNSKGDIFRQPWRTVTERTPVAPAPAGQ